MDQYDKVRRGEIGPLTEPEIVSLQFVTGGAIEVQGNLVRFMGWSEFPMAGEINTERRLCVRLVMPLETALELNGQLVTQLAIRKRTGH